MSKIAFDPGDDPIAANHAEACHRESYVATLIECLETAPREESELYGDYDAWYLGAMEDSLIRRVFIIEAQEWRRQIEDLLRDQLSRSGLDSGLWDTVKEGHDSRSLLVRLRDVLADDLDARVPEETWAGLQEVIDVASALESSSPRGLEVVRERYPSYFPEVDAFGTGALRLDLKPEHAHRAFAAIKAFWDPAKGLPHQSTAEAS